MKKSTKAVKYVYFFGNGKAEGRAEMKGLLGGKGANLAEMTNIGLPVPAGFTISTEVCTYYYANKRKYPKSLAAEVKAALEKVERAMGARFGDPKNPLLVSVRSGARASMPGMMDTILNLGLNDTVAAGLIAKTGQRTVRVRFLPALRADVRRRRARSEAGAQGRDRSVRSHHRREEEGEGRPSGYRADGRRHEGTGRGASSRRSRRRPATISPKIRWTSSGAPSARCSGRGTTTGRSPTGRCTTSPNRGGRR